ncbi:hypothetical protein HPB50_005063 [Hyalomma asiaticum]|uniref:Uncharacterized protein n=1 Tax=Hyalomma asiaticum TaxID=266040 RepID=A0ACB7SK16_HYAAI|nr:hypothetical protein HPB50_005063 [Hyalomma asiaticum]
MHNPSSTAIRSRGRAARPHQAKVVLAPFPATSATAASHIRRRSRSDHAHQRAAAGAAFFCVVLGRGHVDTPRTPARHTSREGEDAVAVPPRLN